MFNFIRLYYKFILKRLFLIPSFCKTCGVDVRDFQVDDSVWEVVKEASGKNVLCYNCFCDECEKLLMPAVWHLDWDKSVEISNKKCLEELAQKRAMQKCNMTEIPQEIGEYYRCSGQMTCEKCGQLYYDHPADPNDSFLNVLCSGQRVKL